MVLFKNNKFVLHSDIDMFLNEIIAVLIKYFLYYSLWTQVHVFKQFFPLKLK